MVELSLKVGPCFFYYIDLRVQAQSLFEFQKKFKLKLELVDFFDYDNDKSHFFGLILKINL